MSLPPPGDIMIGWIRLLVRWVTLVVISRNV